MINLTHPNLSDEASRLSPKQGSQVSTKNWFQFPAPPEHPRPGFRSLRPTPGSMTRLPRRAVTFGDQASDRPRRAAPRAPVTADGELPLPGSVRKEAAEETGLGRARTPPGVRVCTYRCAHAGHTQGPITASLLDPREHSSVFALPPKSIPYLKRPFGASPPQLGEARNESRRLAGEDSALCGVSLLGLRRPLAVPEYLPRPPSQPRWAPDTVLSESTMAQA